MRNASMDKSAQQIPSSKVVAKFHEKQHTISTIARKKTTIFSQLFEVTINGSSCI